MLNFFSQEQLFNLILCACVYLAAALFFAGDRKRPALILLLLGSVSIGLFMATLDPFLMPWDEQVHALVARNMLLHPFHPTLYEIPLLPFDYRDWTQNHTWVHKQPLFLWQMALSLKIFGFNEVALRLPSVLMHAATTLLIYRLESISMNARTGFYAALLFSVCNYSLELLCGRFATDHNDTAFLFYVAASFWALFEYRAGGSSKWIILIGIFAGCAVLIKWLLGLVVFAAWAVALITEKGFALRFRDLRPPLTALLVAVLLFLPWQLYIHLAFPLETAWEMEMVHAHFSHPVDGHDGDYLYHFNALGDLYGKGKAMPWLLLAGFMLLLRNAQRFFAVAIASAVVLIYSLYTLAATKMTSFCFVAAPFAFLGLGAFIEQALALVSRVRLMRAFVPSIMVSLLIVCAVLIFDLPSIARYHTNWQPVLNCDRNGQYREMQFISKLKAGYPRDTLVVFNVRFTQKAELPVMFYTHHIAYGTYPEPADVARISARYKVAVVDDGHLPDYLLNDPSVIRIDL
jgi:4-amino-4-deoxy-L-arabinose transferase